MITASALRTIVVTAPEAEETLTRAVALLERWRQFMVGAKDFPLDDTEALLDEINARKP